MKVLKFERSGVCYRLATFYGPIEKYHKNLNICDYAKGVAIGSLTVTIITAFLAALAVSAADCFIWIGVMLQYGVYLLPSEQASIFLAIVISFVVMALFAAYRIATSKPFFERESQFSRTYNAWRTKTCVKVEFVK